MKTLGIIGGIGPLSTIEYYKHIIEKFKDSRVDDYYPHILIESLNMAEVMEQLDFENYDKVKEILLKSIRNLEAAGADIIAIASSSCHILIDDIRLKSNLPIISIVDCVYDKLVENEYRRVLLIGNSFTLTHNIYQKKFSKYPIKTIVPDSMDIQRIQEAIYPNLENGIIIPYKKEEINNIIQNIIANEKDIDCLVIGSCELNMLIKDEDTAIPIVDSTKVHIDRIVKEILKK
jgi:aspartate racemase